MPAKSPAANVQQKEVGRQPNPRDGKNDARDGGAPDNGENADNCYICDNGGSEWLRQEGSHGWSCRNISLLLIVQSLLILRPRQCWYAATTAINPST